MHRSNWVQNLEEMAALEEFNRVLVTPDIPILRHDDAQEFRPVKDVVRVSYVSARLPDSPEKHFDGPTTPYVYQKIIATLVNAISSPLCAWREKIETRIAEGTFTDASNAGDRTREDLSKEQAKRKRVLIVGGWNSQNLPHSYLEVFSSVIRKYFCFSPRYESESQFSNESEIRADLIFRALHHLYSLSYDEIVFAVPGKRKASIINSIVVEQLK